MKREQVRGREFTFHGYMGSDLNNVHNIAAAAAVVAAAVIGKGAWKTGCEVFGWEVGLSH